MECVGFEHRLELNHIATCLRIENRQFNFTPIGIAENHRSAECLFLLEDNHSDGRFVRDPTDAGLPLANKLGLRSSGSQSGDQ